MNLIPSIDSKYYLANLKNRRVLGNQSKSISFRTHEKIPLMHRNLSLEVKDISGKNITLTVSIMTYLTRLYICQLVSPIIDSGHRICQEHDIKELIAMGLLPSETQINKKQITANLYDSQQIKEYLSTLPEIISFRLFEYEKQILYLLHLIDIGKGVVVAKLRYLYHADPSVIENTIAHFNQDSEIFLSLYLGLDEDILRNMITFHSYSE